MKKDARDDSSRLAVLAIAVFALVLVIAAVVVGTSLMPTILSLF